MLTEDGILKKAWVIYDHRLNWTLIKLDLQNILLNTKYICNNK